MAAVDMHCRGLWEADDGELLEAAWKFLRDLEANSRPAAASVLPTNG
jgi:hypothetical protein